MPHPHVTTVARALPPHHASQERLTEALRALWSDAHFNPERLDALHRAVQVRGRHLALPLEAYPALRSFRARNDAWLRAAVDLGAEATRRALDAAGLSPRDIDHVFFVTVTGLARASDYLRAFPSQTALLR